MVDSAVKMAPKKKIYTYIYIYIKLVVFIGFSHRPHRLFVVPLGCLATAVCLATALIILSHPRWLRMSGFCRREISSA